MSNIVIYGSSLLFLTQVVFSKLSPRPSFLPNIQQCQSQLNSPYQSGCPLKLDFTVYNADIDSKSDSESNFLHSVMTRNLTNGNPPSVQLEVGANDFDLLYYDTVAESKENNNSDSVVLSFEPVLEKYAILHNLGYFYNTDGYWNERVVEGRRHTKGGYGGYYNSTLESDSEKQLEQTLKTSKTSQHSSSTCPTPICIPFSNNQNSDQLWSVPGRFVPFPFAVGDDTRQGYKSIESVQTQQTMIQVSESDLEIQPQSPLHSITSFSQFHIAYVDGCSSSLKIDHKLIQNEGVVIAKYSGIRELLISTKSKTEFWFVLCGKSVTRVRQDFEKGNGKYVNELVKEDGTNEIDHRADIDPNTGFPKFFLEPNLRDLGRLILKSVNLNSFEQDKHRWSGLDGLFKIVALNRNVRHYWANPRYSLWRIKNDILLLMLLGMIQELSENARKCLGTQIISDPYTSQKIIRLTQLTMGGGDQNGNEEEEDYSHGTHGNSNPDPSDPNPQWNSYVGALVEYSQKKYGEEYFPGYKGWERWLQENDKEYSQREGEGGVGSESLESVSDQSQSESYEGTQSDSNQIQQSDSESLSDIIQSQSEDQVQDSASESTNTPSLLNLQSDLNFNIDAQFWQERCGKKKATRDVPTISLNTILNKWLKFEISKEQTEVQQHSDSEDTQNQVNQVDTTQTTIQTTTYFTPPIQFLKIDAQGADLHVITSLFSNTPDFKKVGHFLQRGSIYLGFSFARGFVGWVPPYLVSRFYGFADEVWGRVQENIRNSQIIQQGNTNSGTVQQQESVDANHPYNSLGWYENIERSQNQQINQRDVDDLYIEGEAVGLVVSASSFDDSVKQLISNQTVIDPETQRVVQKDPLQYQLLKPVTPAPPKESDNDNDHDPIDPEDLLSHSLRYGTIGQQSSRNDYGDNHNLLQRLTSFQIEITADACDAPYENVKKCSDIVKVLYGMNMTSQDQCGDLMNTQRFQTCVGDFKFYNRRKGQSRYQRERRRVQRVVRKGNNMEQSSVTIEKEISEYQNQSSRNSHYSSRVKPMAINTNKKNKQVNPNKNLRPFLSGSLQILDEFPIPIHPPQVLFLLLQVDCRVEWQMPTVTTSNPQFIGPLTLKDWVNWELYGEMDDESESNTPRSLSFFSNWRHYTRALASPFWKEAHDWSTNTEFYDSITRLWNSNHDNRWSRQHNGTLGSLTMGGGKKFRTTSPFGVEFMRQESQQSLGQSQSASDINFNPNYNEETRRHIGLPLRITDSVSNVNDNLNDNDLNESDESNNSDTVTSEIPDSPNLSKTNSHTQTQISLEQVLDHFFIEPYRYNRRFGGNTTWTRNRIRRTWNKWENHDDKDVETVSDSDISESESNNDIDFDSDFPVIVRVCGRRDLDIETSLGRHYRYVEVIRE